MRDLDFITHKLAHRDGELLDRYNKDLGRWERWLPLAAQWFPHSEILLCEGSERIVSFDETFAEPVYAY